MDFDLRQQPRRGYLQLEGRFSDVARQVFHGDDRREGLRISPTSVPRRLMFRCLTTARPASCTRGCHHAERKRDIERYAGRVPAIVLSAGGPAQPTSPASSTVSTGQAPTGLAATPTTSSDLRHFAGIQDRSSQGERRIAIFGGFGPRRHPYSQARLFPEQREPNDSVTLLINNVGVPLRVLRPEQGGTLPVQPDGSFGPRHRRYVPAHVNGRRQRFFAAERR